MTLEVGATYRHELGSDDFVLLDVDVDPFGRVPVRFTASGRYGLAEAARLVRVIPTPADRYVVIDKKGEEFPIDGLAEARRLASKWDAEDECCIPHRVARFSFAGWVDPQDTPTKDTP